MKKLASAVLAFAACVSTASAADLMRPAEPRASFAVTERVRNWTGFYVGAHVGGAWTNGTYNRLVTDPFFDLTAGEAFGSRISGILGGTHIGYNWQATPNFVLGVEASASFLGNRRTGATPAGGTVIGTTDTFTLSNNFLGGLAGRAGFAVGNALIYGKAGLALGTFGFRQAQGGVAYNSSATRAGLLLGAGVEYAFAPNWSVGVEYNFNRFGGYFIPAASCGAPGCYRVTNDVHVAKVSLNYLFSTGAVASRY